MEIKTEIKLSKEELIELIKEKYQLEGDIEFIIEEETYKCGYNDESISKKDIDVYRMSLYPDKGKKRGSDEMIDKIGQKLKNNDATKISYTRRIDDGVDVEFSIGDIKYKAIFNHTGTCEKLEKC